MITLTGNSLTIEQIKKVCFEFEPVEIAQESLTAVQKSRDAVDRIVGN